MSKDRPKRRKSSTSRPTIEGWPPLHLTKVPVEDIQRGDGPTVCKRIEALCTVSRDGFSGKAGEPLRLRGWQRQLLYRLFARRPDGRLRHRVALIGLPRKNGKSALGSALGLDGLLFGGMGAEVYSAAAEKDQARIVFTEAKRTVQGNPELEQVCNPMRDVIEVPSTNSVYRVLSAEAYSKEGLNISRAIVDELHAHPNDELWNVLTLASAARIDPLVVAITTAGVMVARDGEDSVCYRLFRHGIDVAGGLVDDPSFFFAWWGAPPGASYQDPATWKAANPGYGDLIDPDDFASTVVRTPENEFRTKRLNQWVAGSDAWLPDGAWEACEDATRTIEDHARVVLGFDGSFNGDSTALVAVTTEDVPHIDVVEAWEKPPDDRGDWKVPRQAVKDAIRDACQRFSVAEIAWDAYLWLDAAEELDEEGLPVVTFPQNVVRMAPATQRFYEAVTTERLTHSGDPRLARHVANCVPKTDSRGTRLTKDSKHSLRKIDLAIASVMALDSAARLSNIPERKGGRMHFSGRLV